MTGADLGEGRAQERGDAWCHDFTAVFGGQHDVRVQFVDHVTAVTPIIRHPRH